MPERKALEKQVNAARDTLNEKDGIDCSVCGNKGLLFRIDVAGCLYVARCECSAKRNSLRLMRRSGLENLVTECSFSTFRTPDAFTRQAKLKAHDYVNHGEARWFFLSGRPGCGKTHLCTAICRRLLGQNIPVRYLLWREDGPRLKAMVNNAPERYAAEMEDLYSVPVLYIDDFFKGKVSDGDINLAFTLINARYIRHCRTIISTERSMAEILKLDEAIGSRITQRAEGYLLSAPAGAINWRYRTAAKKEKT